MTVWFALAVVVALLTFPWFLMPRVGPTEIRGVTRVLWWLNAFYCHFWHRLKGPEADPLPASGPVILISNHTCCIDHMLLQATTRRALGFVIAKEYFDYWLFRPFCKLIGCIPVRRDGRDLAATRAALRALGEGRVVPIFPEGRIYPSSGRELGEGKPGVAYLALTARVPVIPAYVCGTPATNEVFPSLATPSRARVTFGPPVDLSAYVREGKVDREHLDDVTDLLMGAIRALRDRVQGEAGGGSDAAPGGSEVEVRANGRGVAEGAGGVSRGRAALGNA